MICTPETSNIRLVGCDGGRTYHLWGQSAGVEGVFIEQGGMEALVEAPITSLERKPTTMDGGVLRAVKTEIMEPVLQLVVSSQHVNESFGVVDGELREAFSHEKDPFYEQSTLARIEWETGSTVRWIEVVLAPGSTYEAVDPHTRGSFWVWEVHLKAYDPFWREADDIIPVTFDAPGTKTIVVSNLTGLESQHKWTGTVAQWRLPDNSWAGRPWERQPGGMYPDRTILYPALTAANGGITVDYGPTDLPVRDVTNTNLAGQMPVPGDFPKHPLPRFCQEIELAVTAVQVPAEGAAMTLRMPRRSRKPWGRV